jgi:hypothetical protein
MPAVAARVVADTGGIFGGAEKPSVATNAEGTAIALVAVRNGPARAIEGLKSEDTELVQPRHDRITNARRQ